MLTLNLKCEILPDRIITIKLPEHVRPGLHNVVVVLDEKEQDQSASNKGSKQLMKFAGSVKSFKNVDGVTYQRETRKEWN